MKYLLGPMLVTALVTTAMPAAPAFAGPREDYARSTCSDRVRGQYDADARDMSVSENGYDRFVVSGEARRGNETASFTCRTDRGYVQSLSLGGWRRGGGNDTGKTVAAVGLAVGLAAIIAAASSKRRNDQHDRYGRPDYDRRDDGYYNNNDSYSPTGGIVCYRAQRACYDDYHNYSTRWSQREFDY